MLYKLKISTVSDREKYVKGTGLRNGYEMAMNIHIQ